MHYHYRLAADLAVTWGFLVARKIAKGLYGMEVVLTQFRQNWTLAVLELTASIAKICLGPNDGLLLFNV